VWSGWCSSYGDGEQQSAARLEHRGERSHQPDVVGEVLDRLQADDLVEGAQIGPVLLDLAQVDQAEVDTRDAELLGAPAGIVLLALRERPREHGVTLSRRVDAESAVSAAGVERARGAAAQVPAQPQPAIEHARVAMNQERAPAEGPQHRVRHAGNIYRTPGAARPRG
jgi:hypothetical protein